MVEKYKNDQWVLDDHFGLGKTGDLVARMALEVTPPFTIGVNGKWGSGKTSIIRRAFATLGGHPVVQAVPLGAERKENTSKTWDQLLYSERSEDLKWEGLSEVAEQSLCIWFSPWQHQNEHNPIIPLLLEIQNQFSVKHKLLAKGKELNRRGGLAALSLMERVIDMSTGLMGKSLNMKGTSEAVRKAWNSAEPEFNKLSDGQRFHLSFEDAVESMLDSFKQKERKLDVKARIIIFIDDLDRCEEQVVVRLLEAIKLYLDTRRCVFVLGMDDTAILGALNRYWQRSEDDNREYLEKLLQATIHIPLPNDKKVGEDISLQLAEHSFTDCDACATCIVALLEPNPRKIKNFVNSLCASWHLFEHSENIEYKEEERFIMFHYLRLFHRPIWRVLERQPAALQLLHMILLGGLTAAETEIEGMSHDDQRMLKLFIQRSFSHVLRDEEEERKEDSTLHHGQSLDDAVIQFHQRQDRKHSDEYFKQWLTTKIEFSECTPQEGKNLLSSYLRIGG